MFVFTVRSNLSGYFAVTPWGDASVNGTRRSSPVTASFSTNDAPQCHLQVRTNTSTGYPISFYMMWADGDQDEGAGRADFPVLANRAKNGAPHLFYVLEPKTGLPADGVLPATMALHSGEAEAGIWLPIPSKNFFDVIGLEPANSLLIALDDKMYRLNNGLPSDQDTRWLGWTRNYDPFVNINYTNAGNTVYYGPEILPANNDVVVNYTQRRVAWILDWLTAHERLDAKRVSVLGHSAGSMGSLAFAKAYPNRISSCMPFNAGLRGPGSAQIISIHGTTNQNLPVTLTNRFGQQMHTEDVWHLTTGISAERDLPLIRIFDGKNDTSDQMGWLPSVVDQYREADTNGIGAHLYWDLRHHGQNTWTDFWTDINDLGAQTRRDDATNQIRYRADQSFPAFFHLQNDPNHGDPGDGTTGSTTNSDDHGTWGGYFDWQTNLVDTPTNWQCTVFLVGTNTGYALVDACPFTNLTAAVALRKPQQFLPAANENYLWTASTTNGVVLQSGVGTTDTNALVTLPVIGIPRDPARLVLEVRLPPALTVTQTTGTQILLTAWLTSGFQFQLQNSTNLTVWVNLGGAITGSNTRFTATRNLSQPTQFYRLVVTP